MEDFFIFIALMFLLNEIIQRPLRLLWIIGTPVFLLLFTALVMLLIFLLIAIGIERLLR